MSKRRPTAKQLLARDKFLQRLVARMEDYGAQQVILFGSRARGDNDRYSDYDIAIVKQTNLRFVERLTEVVKYIYDLGKAVEIFVYTPEELLDMEHYDWGEMLKREGIVIYSKAI
ncbi:MAG: nucleotidyltransferase domain-containing protein [Calditrichaeota bacterium]|nr:nucleotidyltransferase domain-containing protein [Calditrichota bacterium]